MGERGKIFFWLLILIICISLVVKYESGNNMTGNAAGMPCEDTDNPGTDSYPRGEDYYKKGQTTSLGVTETDSCTDSDWLKEWYCPGQGSSGYKGFSCGNQGEICVDGRCIKNICECVNCVDCNTKLNDSSCNYIKLTQNIATTNNCINSTFSDKIFDCQNYEIVGNQSGNSISILGNINNTIKNFKIYNFSNGIYLLHGDSTRIQNITIENNSQKGLESSESAGIEIKESKFCKNNLSDITINGGSGTYTQNICNNTNNAVVCQSLCPAPICTSNFTAVNTSCRVGDVLETWYNDTNSCGSSSPANATYKCDYDNNGFIGNFSSLIQTRTNLGVYLDSSLGNISKAYNLTKKIEFKENNITIIEFNYNFSLSGPLDFSKIEVTKQTNSSEFGYLVIKGIELNKTIRVDKLDELSDSVCIRNSQSAQISSFSNNCDSSSEVLLNCPGNHSQYKCTISNNQFVISGLTSSAVKEMIFSEEDEECISDWNCEEWGECDNDIKARICVDLNWCEEDRVEEESCAVGQTQCIPDWKCTEWGPTECPETAKQTRVCTDANNCGVLTNKLAESKSCKYGFSGFIFWILFIVLISLILIAVILIIYSYKKRLNP